MRAARTGRKTLQKKLPAHQDSTLTVIASSPVESAQVVPLAAFDPGNAVLPATDTIVQESDIFSWCAALLAHSPVAAGLLRDVAQAGWQAGMADLHHGGFHLDIASKKLIIDSFSMTPQALARSIYFRNSFLLTLIRALRDIHHEMRFGAFETDYGPESVLMLERARAADCDTVTVQAAWELRGAGFAEVWRHLLGSDEGDMAMIFTRYLERDPAAAFDGAALAYAFRQWYADEDRVASCDHETLESLDDVLLTTPETGNPFGQKELAPQAMEAVSILPGGSGICYLAGLGATVTRDPFFCGMNDAVNQTHFFHLMYDLEVTMVNNVPFRDGKLARKIFPGAEAIKTRR